MWETADLGIGLLIVGAWLGGLALITWAGIWWTRRRRSDTLALTVTRSLAGIVTGLSLFSLIFGGINQFIVQPTWLDESMRTWVDGHLGSLQSPVCDADGSLLEGSPVGERVLSYCGGAINNLPFAPRLALFIATVFSFLATVAVAWSVYTAALLASQREPFHRSVHRTFALAGIITVVAGVFANAVTTIGMTLAVRSLVWIPGSVQPPFAWSLPLLPFAVAIGLFALSAIFRYGAQLERAKEQLQRETDGLV